MRLFAAAISLIAIGQATSNVLEAYDLMEDTEKQTKCDGLSGTMYEGKCYTFEGTINGITDVIDGAPDLRQLIKATECPGGCAIWAETCAPATWQEMCEHARNHDRDIMRKTIFYIFMGVFTVGLLFVCLKSGEEAGTKARFGDDDDNFERAA